MLINNLISYQDAPDFPEVFQGHLKNTSYYKLWTQPDHKLDNFASRSSSSICDNQQGIRLQEDYCKIAHKPLDINESLEIETSEMITSRTDHATQTEISRSSPENCEADHNEYRKLLQLAEKYGCAISESPKKREAPTTTNNESKLNKNNTSRHKKLQRITMQIPKASYVGFQDISSRQIEYSHRYVRYAYLKGIVELKIAIFEERTSEKTFFNFRNCGKSFV